MRWNVVIGGQLFSKSFLGYTTYKLGLIDREGLLVAIVLTVLPLFILWGLVKLLPPWEHGARGAFGNGLRGRLRPHCFYSNCLRNASNNCFNSPKSLCRVATCSSNFVTARCLRRGRVVGAAIRDREFRTVNPPDNRCA